MAEKKNTTESETAAAPQTLTSQGTAGKPLAKQEAVRIALETMGVSTPRQELRKYIQDNLGMDVSLDHISASKGKLIKEGQFKKPRKKRTKAATAASPVAEKPAATPSTTTTTKAAAPLAPKATESPNKIALEDILLVRQLVDRVGPGSLHVLIDAMMK